MKKRVMGRAAYGAIAIVLSFVSTAGSAHHSFGMFDMQKTLTVQGTVKDFQWANPHVWIDVVVPDPVKKQVFTYSVEADAVTILTRRGWTRNSLKLGEKVTVVVHPLKTGQLGGSLVSASVDGKTVGSPPDFKPS